MKKLLLVLMLITPFFFFSCGDDDPFIPNEEEVITTLSYNLTPMDGGASVILNFQDLDGDGGMDPIFSEGTLAANTTYNGIISLLNETESPADNITFEVEEEGADHQFFFDSNISGLSVAYNDQDENGAPIGITNILTTGDSAAGNLTITLRHEPNKSASGVSDGAIANAGGETDIEVTFTINVQ